MGLEADSDRTLINLRLSFHQMMGFALLNPHAALESVLLQAPKCVGPCSHQVSTLVY